MVNERDEIAAIDALDRHWNARQTDPGRVEVPAEVDPALAATVAALHRLSEPDGPDAAFVNRLERELMSQIPATAAGSANNIRSIDHSGAAPSPLPRGRGVSRVLEVLAAAVLIALIGGGLLLSRGLWLDDRVPPTTIAGFAPETSLVATPSTVSEADEATYFGNAARTSQVPGPGPRNEPRIVNAYDIPTDVTTSGPLLATADSVYVLGMALSPDQAEGPSDTHVLLAFDTSSGELRWRQELGAAGAEIEPSFAVAGPRVYVGLAVSDPSRALPRGALLALHSRTGEEAWRFDYPAAGLSEPAVHDGVVYAGSQNGSVVALDALTGAERWISEVPLIPDATEILWPSTVAVTGDTIFAAGGDEQLFAMDAATGAERWRVEAAGMRSSHPAATASRVFFTGRVEIESAAGPVHGKRLLALDAATGEELWRRDIPADFSTTATIATDELVVIPHFPFELNDDAQLLGFDAATGAELWTYANNQHMDEYPVLSDGIIYLADWTEENDLPGPLRDLPFIGGADLAAIEAATGQELWRVDTDKMVSRRLAVAGGKVLLIDHQGKDDNESNAIFVYGDDTN